VLTGVFNIDNILVINRKQLNLNSSVIFVGHLNGLLEKEGHKERKKQRKK
jgi:hypothetical protein